MNDRIGMVGSQVVDWQLRADETGNAVLMPFPVTLNIQVTGNLGGAIVMFEGCNEAEPQNWAMMCDRRSDQLEFTDTHVLKTSESVPRWIRPAVSGGDGNTKINVIAVVRKVVS